MTTLRLGTRRSALAQAQSHFIADTLRRQFPDLQIEIVLITTSGDQGRTPSPQDGAGGLKAMFTKEIEDALLRHEIDLAVHSLKDMAAELPDGLVIGAFPEREDPRDAWISRNKQPFSHLGVGARVGTSSVRRQAQLLYAKRGIVPVPLRGNVDTRLQKLRDENLDGIVLAQAGLKRLGREAEVTEILPEELLLPAVGQGCLAIECRDNDPALCEQLAALDHAPTRQAVTAERAFLRALGGSCQTPIAGYARVADGQLQMSGAVAAPQGTILIRDKDQGAVTDAEPIGIRLAQKLLSKGADRLLGIES